MTPPLELIVAMMPHAARVALDGQAPPRNTGEAEAAAAFTVQVAASMAEEAIRLTSAPIGNRYAEIAELLAERLSTPAQREGVRKGLKSFQSMGLVGITPDATFRSPDPEDEALTIVPVDEILAILDGIESQK